MSSLAVFTVPTLCHTYSKSYLFFVDLTFGWCPVVVKVILAAVGMVVCSIHCHWESAPWDCTFVIAFKLIGLNLFQNGWASKKLAELSWFRVIVTNRISWSINRGWGYKNYEWIVHIWHSIQMSKNGRTLIWWLLWKFHFKKLRFCGHS